jgi:hypothetical protein
VHTLITTLSKHPNVNRRPGHRRGKSDDRGVQLFGRRVSGQFMSFSDVSFITCINTHLYPLSSKQLSVNNKTLASLSTLVRQETHTTCQKLKIRPRNVNRIHLLSASTTTSCFHTTRPSPALSNIAHPDEYTPFKAGGSAKWPKSSLRLRLQWTASRQTETTIRIPFFLLALAPASSSIT